MAREASPNFNMIGWNGMASMNQSIKGSFEFDVVFVNDKPGFVVQFIQKTLTYKKTAASSSWKKRNHAYWEIFYIGEDRMSWNADRFAQTSLGPESEGCLIQIGYASFFPYDKSVSLTNNNVVQITPEIGKIFGTAVQPDKIPSANGLPSSKKKPEMNNLKLIPSAIIHKLTVNWGNHEPLSQQNVSDDGKTFEGWDSIIEEEVFAGETIYQAFPWTATARPFLKDRDEQNRYLSEEDWEETVVNLNRPQEYGQRPTGEGGVSSILCPHCTNSLEVFSSP